MTHDRSGDGARDVSIVETVDVHGDVPADVLRLTAERFVAGGEAIGRDEDGKIVFIRGGIPGDTVEVALTEKKKDWSRGHVVNVVDAGDDRVAEPCAARRAGCGGCDWQAVDPSTQLRHKAAIVADAMRRTAKLPDASISMGPSVPIEGYRTTVRVVGGADGRPAFRADRRAATVPFESCLVAHPRLNEILSVLRIDEGVELTLRVSNATGEATARWDHRHGEVAGLPEWVASDRGARLVEEVGGHRFVVSAASFFQSGPAAAELLVAAVRRAAPELSTATTVVDAYAGVGLFAVTATRPSSKLITIESGRSSHADSIENLHGRDADIVRSEVAHWTPATMSSEHADGSNGWIGAGIDVVIADPSRTGLGKPGSAALARAGAPILVLVSCDPVALARDAALLADRGYRHVHSEVLDVFPMTHHVETVTRFERTDT